MNVPPTDGDGGVVMEGWGGVEGGGGEREDVLRGCVSMRGCLNGVC